MLGGLSAVGVLASCGPKALPPGERPLLLWEVEREGVVSHLLGTCHIPMPLSHAMPNPMRADIFSTSRIVVGEIDMQKEDLDSTMALAFSSRSLRERIGAEPFRALSVRVRDTVPATALDRMSPWIASSLLMSANGRTDSPGSLPMDLAVMQAAQGANLPYLGLESLASQAALLVAYEDDLVKELRSTSDPVRAAWSDQQDLLQACADTDPVAVARVVRSLPAELDAALLSERNQRWMTRLGPEFAQGGVLLAVGAGHMLGRKGLVSLLQKSGYRVTPITAPMSTSSWAPRLPAAPPPLEPAPSAERMDAWVSAIMPAVLSGSCGPRGVLELCGLETPASCPERVRHDIGLCVEQHSDRLPANAPSKLMNPDQAGAVLPCMMAGATAALLAMSESKVPDACPYKSMMNAPPAKR